MNDPLKNVTYGDLIDMGSALQELSDMSDLSFAVRVRVGVFMREAANHVAAFEDQRRNIAIPLTEEPDDEGNRKFKSPEAVAEYNAKLKELRGVVARINSPELTEQEIGRLPIRLLGFLAPIIAHDTLRPTELRVA